MTKPKATPALKLLHQFLSAAMSSGIDGAEMREAMEWVLERPNDTDAGNPASRAQGKMNARHCCNTTSMEYLADEALQPPYSVEKCQALATKIKAYFNGSGGISDTEVSAAADMLQWAAGQAFQAKMAPQAVQAAAVPEAIEQMAADRYKVVPSHESMLHRWAVVAGEGTQQLYIGREGECQNMARKFMGAFLDGAFVAMQEAIAAQAKQGGTA